MVKDFQEFRCKGEVIRIETITDSDGEQCVLWRDIRTAFPGMTRIQHGSMFVPVVKDSRFYRKKPHRILYHPGVVLDVIYMSDSPKTRSPGNDPVALDTPSHDKSRAPGSRASLSSYCTCPAKAGFMEGVSGAGGTAATCASKKHAPVASIDGGPASLSAGETVTIGASAATVSQDQSQKQKKHGPKPWFSGLMQTLPTLSTKPKGSSTVGLPPPFLSLSPTSVTNVNASSGSLSKSKSPAKMLSTVPSSVTSSSSENS
ncbi:unnamed protein product [Mortierella alpina]